MDWQDEGVQGDLKNRRVKHYGFDFVYGSNTIDPAKPNDHPFPGAWNSVILDRCLTSGALKDAPDQCTVNRYEPGQGIAPHVDAHGCCGDGIAALSLGAEVVMEFGGPDGRRVPMLLPRRSLMVMSGEAR